MNLLREYQSHGTTLSRVTLDNIDEIAASINLKSPSYDLRIREIAEGNRGNYYLVLGDHGLSVIKDIGIEKYKDILPILSEISFMQELQHERIMKVNSFLIDLPANTFEIELEYCPTDLSSLFPTIRQSFQNVFIQKSHVWEYVLWDEMKDKYANQILEAVSFIHSKNIVHGDIRPKNILLDIKGNIKVTGFQYALREGCETNIRGHVMYLAPEFDSNETLITNRGTDFWATGITLVELYVGMNPMIGGTIEKKDRLPHIQSLLSVRLDKKTANKILSLLEIDPSKRSILQ